MKHRPRIIAAALSLIALCAGTAAAAKGDQATRARGELQEGNAVRLNSFPSARQGEVVKIIVEAHKCTESDARQRLKKLPAYISSAVGTTTTERANEILQKLLALGAKAEMATVQASVVSVEVTQDSLSDQHDEAARFPSPSAQEQKAAKAAGWEKGLGSDVSTTQADYRRAASDMGFWNTLADDFMMGVTAGRLDKAELNGYKAGYAAFTEAKKSAKGKVAKKVGTTTLAKDAGYTDASEIERFKRGADKAQKDVAAGKKLVTPKYSNPYK